MTKLDPYRGPTEEEAMLECGTTLEFVEALNEAFGKPQAEAAPIAEDDDE